MNPRAVVVQGGLALVALIVAYLTWQRSPELVAGEVLAVDIGKSDLERVRFQDDENHSWSELIRERDSDGTFVAVQISGSDASSIPMPAAHPSVPVKVPQRMMRGNDSALRLFEKLAPLRALRSLGQLDEGKLKDVGLAGSKKSLEIVGRGTKRRFSIAPAPPGGSDPYIRDQVDGRVYIIQRSIFADLQSASVNLIERRMHNFRLEDADRLVMTAGDKKKEFKVSRIEELPGVRLTPAGGDKPDETAKNWHDRVWGLFPGEVMGKGELPKNGPPKLALRLEYFMRGHMLGWLELSRDVPPKRPEGDSSSARPLPASDLTFARSEFPLGYMKLPIESLPLVTDGENLVNRK